VNSIISGENSIGQDSSYVVATIHQEKEYLIYIVFVLDSNNNIHKVIVYSGNEVISTKEISIMDISMHDKPIDTL
jgi:hypothetical protein